MHEYFVEPSIKYADIIVSYYEGNEIAIDMIATKIKALFLEKKSKIALLSFLRYNNHCCNLKTKKNGDNTMNEEILLTKEGIKDLQEELDNLINVVRPEVIEELKEARAQGDLSENADYDAARNRQAEVEGRIKEIESLLTKAKEIKEVKSKTGIIKLGSTVTFTNLLINKKYELKIVGVVEANPFENTISNESPIAKAIIGKKVGDLVEIKEIQEPYKVKIITVE